MSAIFGIDFGTSNSALSVNIGGKVRLLDVDRENPISNSLKSNGRSCVFFLFF